jgi:ParB-like nuclease domain
MAELMQDRVAVDDADTEADRLNAIGAMDVTVASATAPIEYPLNHVTADYADFTREELDALRKSVREHGLLVPIVIWRDQIVDGRHRAEVCREETRRHRRLVVAHAGRSITITFRTSPSDWRGPRRCEADLRRALRRAEAS